jgi:V/A-type H+-transporting ATPase subunit E
VELLLPAELVSLEDLRRKPEAATPGSLMQFVLSQGGGMLRDGMSFGVADDGEAGIRVRLVQDDLQIDLTEKAVSQLLLRHMLPRFRALLRGAVAAESSGDKRAEPPKK